MYKQILEGNNWMWSQEHITSKCLHSFSVFWVRLSLRVQSMWACILTLLLQIYHLMIDSFLIPVRKMTASMIQEIYCLNWRIILVSHDQNRSMTWGSLKSLTSLICSHLCPLWWPSQFPVGSSCHRDLLSLIRTLAQHAVNLGRLAHKWMGGWLNVSFY